MIHSCMTYMLIIHFAQSICRIAIISTLSLRWVNLTLNFVIEGAGTEFTSQDACCNVLCAYEMSHDWYMYPGCFILNEALYYTVLRYFSCMNADSDHNIVESHHDNTINTVHITPSYMTLFLVYIYTLQCNGLHHIIRKVSILYALKSVWGVEI